MFRINMNPAKYTYEIYIDTQLVNKQTSVAPTMVHKAQYMELIQELSNDSRPMRFKIIAEDEVIWDEIEQKHKSISNYLEFKNNAYLDKYGRE